MSEEKRPAGRRPRLEISPRLSILLIGGIAIGGIVCMAVTVLVIIFARDL